MVRHIVMWRLKDSAEGASARENAARVKERLEALNGAIPGMIRLEVGLDRSATETSSDLVLCSDFEDWEALRAYQEHPGHREVVPFVAAVTAERRMVDYEC